jgi:hypothetical protein
VDRRRSLSIVVLVAIAFVGLIALVNRGADTRPTACDDVRLVAVRAERMGAPGRPAPVSADYRTEATAARQVAVQAPSGVRLAVDGMANALSLLATHLEGFDPENPATYSLVEQRSIAIEQAQSELDDAIGRANGWFSKECA